MKRFITVLGLLFSLSFSIQAQDYSIEAGNYDAEDATGKKLQIRVINVRVDTRRPSGKALDDQYGNKEVELAFFTPYSDKLFVAKSVYSSMWSAYEINRMTAQIEISPGRYEFVTIQLAKGERGLYKIASVHFRREAFFQIFGWGIGRKDCELFISGLAG
jgi:hypothetical protein